MLYVNWDVSFLRCFSEKPWEEYIRSRSRGKGRNGSREIHDRLRDALFIRRKCPIAFSLAGSCGWINSDRNTRNERRMATTDALTREEIFSGLLIFRLVVEEPGQCEPKN